MPKTSVVTRKGQITIPAEFRQRLGLKEGDTVELHWDDTTLTVIPLGSVTDKTYGLARKTGRALSSKELKEATETAIADDVMERMSRHAAAVS
jgi:AbrB family looped-hinge helix DNA binding protein